MILNCSNISKTFIDNTILNNVSFHIEDGEKAAIVGANGVGKSTLLKIIIGELAPDDGSVTISKDKTMGYLAQHQSIDGNNTIYEEVLSVKQDVMSLELSIRQLETDMKNAKDDVLNEMLEKYTRLNHEFEQQNGYAVRSEIAGVIKGLGFTEDEFDKKISSLSGGQKTRVALCRLLLTKPDILLLDAALQLEYYRTGGINNLNIVLLCQRISLRRFTMGTKQHLHTVKLLHLLMVDGDESRLMQALHLHAIMHNITQAVECTALFQLFFSFLDGSGYAEAETTTMIYFYLHYFTFILITTLAFSGSLVIMRIRGCLARDFFRSAATAVTFIFTVSPG